jgi:hypothetical protein
MSDLIKTGCLLSRETLVVTRANKTHQNVGSARGRQRTQTSHDKCYSRAMINAIVVMAVLDTTKLSCAFVPRPLAFVFVIA